MEHTGSTPWGINRFAGFAHLFFKHLQSSCPDLLGQTKYPAFGEFAAVCFERLDQFNRGVYSLPWTSMPGAC